MRPLFNTGPQVPLSRVIREHRAALAPLAIVLVINIIVLIAVVLPLSQRVSANESRAAAADRALAAANVEFKRAEALRDGKARASTDLETFYKDVLPAGVAAARRMTHLQFQQKAREHGLQYQRGSTTEEQIRGSRLDRLTVTMTLSGNYDDIRSLLYDLETAPDFFVIDNVMLTEGGDSDALALELEVSTYFRSNRPAEATTGSNGG
jgi:Tfp pilus assembly protein PilO